MYKGNREKKKTRGEEINRVGAWAQFKENNLSIYVRIDMYHKHKKTKRKETRLGGYVNE
jgi:hypothetical protein